VYGLQSTIIDIILLQTDTHVILCLFRWT